MRVSRTFSFDNEKDAELLQFLDGCRNASDSVRMLLRNALGIEDNQSTYKDIPIKPSISPLQTASEKPIQKPTTTSETPSMVTTQSSKGSLNGFDNVLAAMNRIPSK